MLRSSFFQGLATLLSRISGLLRDVIAAQYLGASRISDCFFIAFKIPNTVRKMIGEGPLSSTFMPIFTKVYSNSKNEAQLLSGRILVILLTITTSLVLLGEIFTPQLIYYIAPGIRSNHDAYIKAIMLTRISLPYMIMVTTVALLGAINNGLGKFFSLGFTPAILNITMSAALLILTNTYNIEPGLALIIGTSIGGINQLIFMIIATTRAGCLPKFSAKASPVAKKSVKKFFSSLAPILFTQGLFQINTFIDNIFASMEAKVPSFLYYSNRLSQFAVSIIGHTLGIVVLSKLTQLLARKLTKEASACYRDAIIAGAALSIPAAFGIYLLSSQLIQIIYERGNFLPEDTAHVAKMLQIASVAIPFCVINKIQYSALYAKSKFLLSLRIGVITIAVNFFINISLFRVIPIYYIVISTTIAIMVECTLLSIYIHRNNIFRNTFYCFRAVALSLLYSCIMFAVASYVQTALTHLPILINILATMVSAGIVYVALVYASKAYFKKE